MAVFLKLAPTLSPAYRDLTATETVLKSFRLFGNAFVTGAEAAVLMKGRRVAPAFDRHALADYIYPTPDSRGNNNAFTFA